jgi:hypothetical protein
MRAHEHDSDDNDNDNSISYYIDNEVDPIRRKLFYKNTATVPLSYVATVMSGAARRREM